MSVADKLPLVVGLGFVLGPDGRPVRRTRKGAQRWADEEAARRSPKGFWTGHVVRCRSGWRISFGGQPDRFRK